MPDSIEYITELSYLGLLKMTGPDTKKFLQGQLTCNLEDITETQSRFGAHCNPKGRIISLFRIFYWQEAYYLIMPRELIAIAIQALKKYAVFFKTILSDVSDEWLQVGLCANFSEAMSVDQVITKNNIIYIKIPGNRYHALGTPHNVAQLSNHYTAQPVTLWQKQNIEAGLADIYPESSEKFLPHEINLPALNGVSFTKGCYTGQEIIARMEYRGQLKSRLIRTQIESASDPIRGQDLNERMIVDFCKIGYNTYEILAISNND